MKKFIYLIAIMILFHLAPAKAQWVTIPDANFANKLQQLFPSCMNGNQMDTTCPQILNATSLNIRNSNISDISGIEKFTNLNTLNCRKNQITGISNLPNNLTTLNCDSNLISNLSMLPNGLQHLFCTHNDLTSLGTLPGSLIRLDCSYNPLSLLPALPSSLIELYCANDSLTILPTLPNALCTLSCSYNDFSAGLPLLPDSLRSLYSEHNQLTTLPALPSLLNRLYCRNNQLTSLPALPSHMRFVFCDYNQLTSLPSLSAIPSTPFGFFLNCSYNQLNSLPVLPSHLNVLVCSYNQITSIPAVPSYMQTFIINNNNISCLSNLPQFWNIANISNNPLTCVPNQTNYSLGLPLCMDNDPINNPNYCPGVSNIAGEVYSDLDSDCSLDSTDFHTINLPVKLYDSQNNLLGLTYTVNGAYSFTLLQPDTFVVKIDDASQPFSMDCGQMNHLNVVLDSANQSALNNDFPVICDSVFDIAIQSVARQGWVFPGQTHTLQTNITNNFSWYALNCNSTLTSGTLIITVNGPVSYVAPVNNAFSPFVAGNTFTYSIADFAGLTPIDFGLRFLTDTTAQAGDQICVHVEINPSPIDADTLNNIYDFCYQVVNSYDPNMKEVFPVNVLPGYQDWFTYTIHFQNTGNAPAFNIRLRDTLDTNLDLSSFEVLGYSHPTNVSLYGNVLTVRFNNIMLPDSTSDYEGSMGYFQYRLKPLPNLPNGTQIENTAYIYFDYNAPIVTNTTQNNFQMPVYSKELNAKENDFFIYPNPGKGLFLFRDGKIAQTIEVFNVMGELVLKQENTGQINLQSMPKGIYLARINGFYLSRLVKE